LLADLLPWSIFTSSTFYFLKAMSKTQNLIRYAIAAMFLHVRALCHHYTVACCLTAAVLLPASGHCDTETISLDSSHFDLVTTTFDVGGQTHHATRITLMYTALEGATGIHGRLRLRTNLLANFVVPKSWSSIFDVSGVSISPSQDDPYTVLLDFWATSSSPWGGETGLWMEVVCAGSEGQNLSKVNAAIDGIVQIDIIEGGCKTLEGGALLENELSIAPLEDGHQHLPSILDIQLFPNPAVETIRVQSDAALLGSIRLIDTEGRVVAELQVNAPSVVVDVQHLAPGTYFLVGLADKKILWRKRFLKR
jgi:Secretion system C-terminal sorting domain